MRARAHPEERVGDAAREYARGDVTTKSIEGFFGIFKRGIKCVYQHCGEQQFQRYINEFSFRYNHRIKPGYNDRAEVAVEGAFGKRRLSWNSLALRRLAN